MADKQGDLYILARDGPESARLVEQHRLNAQNYGYLIHPHQLARLPPNARIADVAAGTGVWAIDAVQQLPGSHAVAFDISPEQFPKFQPSNVDFQVADAKKPFPENLHGTFDLVHIHALLAVMMPDDWYVVMQNVLQLLKPGGFLQWEEADNSNVRCLRGKAEFRRYTAIPKLFDTFNKAMGERLGDGFRRLPAAATAHGLVDVDLDIMSTDRVPELRDPMTRMYMVALFGWAKKAAIWPNEELEALKKAADAEIDDGAYFRIETIMLTGQKPE